MNLPFIPTNEITQQQISDSEYKLPLDLNRLLVPHPSSTFLLRSDANHYGVSKGDILVVEKGVTPRNQQLIIAVIDGEMVLSRASAAEVWGMVRYVIHQP